MLINASYMQTTHAVQTREASAAAYETYEAAIEAVIAYFAERRGRYSNEQYFIRLFGIRYDEQEFTMPVSGDLAVTLKDYKEAITIHGKTCVVELTLDGTTNFGSPTLQCVTVRDEVLVENIRKAEQAALVAKYGVCEGCNSPECAHDCGMLWCGCIDTCRGRCGLREEYEYDSDF